jgi:hypothetical protein
VQKGSIGVIMLPFNRIIAINSPIIVIIEKHTSAIFGWVFIAQKRQKAGSDRNQASGIFIWHDQFSLS